MQLDPKGKKTREVRKKIEEIITKIFQTFMKVSPQTKISVNLKHKKHESKTLHKISSKHKMRRDKFNKIYVKFIHGKLEKIIERN